MPVGAADRSVEEASETELPSGVDGLKRNLESARLRLKTAGGDRDGAGRLHTKSPRQVVSLQ